MSKKRALELLRSHPEGISNTHAAQEHGFWTLSQRVGDLILEGYEIKKARIEHRVMKYRFISAPKRSAQDVVKEIRRRGRELLRRGT